ncbi:MAG TPA: DNA-directed RNA polymerase subunit alpha C-terminal domain-containing protein, partial [Candidatus Paceibacterota bacterium]
VGEISVDAIFSPVRRVNYEVENMRVGDRTDFNRLRVTIETDGSITPKRALESAIEILITQLKAIVGWQEEKLVEETPIASASSAAAEHAAASSEENVEAAKTRIEDLELSARTVTALQNANIRTVGGIVRKKEADLLEIEGLGPKSIQEIKRALSNFGITLK